MLIIRPYKQGDISDIGSWLLEERVFRLWNGGFFSRWPQPLDWEAYIQHFTSDPQGQLWTAQNEEGEIVGHFSIRQIEWEKKSAHLGYILIHPAWQGRGYATQMLQKALWYGATLLELKKITLGVYTGNQGAVHLYQKLGFSFETEEIPCPPGGESLGSYRRMACFPE